LVNYKKTRFRLNKRLKALASSIRFVEQLFNTFGSIAHVDRTDWEWQDGRSRILPSKSMKLA